MFTEPTITEIEEVICLIHGGTRLSNLKCADLVADKQMPVQVDEPASVFVLTQIYEYHAADLVAIPGDAPEWTFACRS